MVDGVLIEHSHRLVAGSVVLLTAALAFLLRRNTAFKTALLALGLVVFQAVLGGITVIFRLPPIVSTTHLATSMVFFSTVIYLALRLRRSQGAAVPSLSKVTLHAAIMVYAQMILGAAIRHLGAGLACTEILSCRGAVWPTGVDVTVHLHMLHRAFALAIFAFLIVNAVRVWRASDRVGLRALAVGAPLLASLQIALGIFSITTFRDILPVTAHLGVAALLLADLVTLHLLTRGPLAVAADHPDEDPGAIVEARA
jgi:heme A synthase